MTAARQPTRRYAEDTKVSQQGSEAEIRRLAERYGVAGFVTMLDWAAPQIDEAYRTKRLPPLLPGAETTPVIALPPAREA